MAKAKAERAAAENGLTYPAPVPRRICDLPERMRPREMFDRMGGEGVPDDVLLALLLRHGYVGTNALDLARQVLTEHYPTLADLAKASADELAGIKGIGRVKAQIVRAAVELGRRVAEEALAERPRVATPAEAAAVVRPRAAGLDREVFWMLPLDRKNRLKRPPIEVTRGLVDASLVHPREVFVAAIHCVSAAVVLAHNHPSGDPTPSAQDVAITRQVVEAGRIIGIEVLDHVILGRAAEAGRPDYVSLREANVVAFG